MEQPFIFFIVAGIVLVLVFYYGGASIFTSGPIATGPGRGIGIQSVPSSPRPAGFGGGVNSGGQQTPTSPPGTSPFRGSVRIASVSPNADMQKEYIVINSGYFAFGQNNQGHAINTDGWTVENYKGERHRLPPAMVIPFSNSASEPIQFASGDELFLTTGISPLSYSFKENTCTGYLNEAYVFTPALSESCPDFSVESLLSKNLNSTCVDAIRNAPRCRQVNIAFAQSAAGNECIAFTQTHINYAGCLADTRSAKDFESNRWRAFLGLDAHLWDPTHDKAVLRDKNGLIIDEYSY